MYSKEIKCFKIIILAAGEGRRLRPYTTHSPKAMIPLGGKSILEHQLTILNNLNFHDIHIVTGYKAELIKSLGYPTFYNPDFAQTNMVHSLMCAKNLFFKNKDICIIYGDIIYEPKVILSLMQCNEAFSTAVNTDWYRLWKLRFENPLIDAETLKLDILGHVLEIGKKPSSYDEIHAQFMGLIKVRADFAPTFVNAYLPSFKNIFMTDYLQYLINKGYPLKAVAVEGGWLEVDSIEDLSLYEKLFKDGQLHQFCLLK